MEKNIAGKWVVYAYGLPGHASPDLPVTGDAANITANIRIDGGAANAVDDVNPAELENGYYVFDITAVESNGDLLLLAPTSSTANVRVVAAPEAVYTRPPNFNDLDIAVGGEVSADVVAISGDTGAADNLESQYDNTGLTGDTFPATQAQVGNISSGTSAQGQNATGFVLTTGVETLTFAATTAADGVLHEIAPSGGNTDGYYTTTLSGNSAPVSVFWRGYVQSNADVAEFQFYDWVAAGYVTEKTIIGANGTTLTEEEIPAINSYVGTGANVGEVRFRLLSATTTKIATDRIIFDYTTVAAESGFEGGMVWVDTIDGQAGTARGIGIATNPVLTIGDAITIAANNSLHQFSFPSDSTLAPTGDFNGYTVHGVRYDAVLGGHDWAGTLMNKAAPVSGTATTAVTADSLVLIECLITTMTSDDVYFLGSVFAGTYTFGTSGIVSPTVNMTHCKSGLAGSSSPVFTKTPGATLTWAVRDWKGGMTVNGLEAGDVVTIGGTELGTITLNGADASVEVRGIAKAVVNNLTGSPTVNLDGVIIASNTADIPGDVWDEALSGHNVGGSAGKALRQIKEGTVSVEGEVNDVSATASSFVTNLTETTDDHYRDVSFVFIGGTLIGQSRPVISYNGTTKIVTFDEPFTEAPADGDGFIIKTDHVHAVSDIAIETSDTLLNRDISTVTDTNSRTLLNAIRFLRNKWSVSGTTLTVTKEDDTTTAWTATVSTDAAAEPVTGTDPS